MTQENPIAQTEKTAVEKPAKLTVLIPSVDIYENNDEYLVYADLPGVKKEDVSIDLDNGQLTLIGNRYVEAVKGQLMAEFSSAQYRRVFSVPQGIDLARVDAELTDGVLKLHLPKSEAVKPRKIEIREG
ncbi:Hsp20/alpha crystallin family protein [Desulfoprunum benzoelyticum]|uniref:HSP20 family molecular chaperone IbpA n=1 Tax=Desulfoprunum benzoelyticum TaxID=1506996 RepID=A0A840UVA2_9BACT|nr:Hsp20/alpha crystallin family protein [Desulfoprunum benzoelyticum]MBB5347334.1 HSP20 family molecular chaperone IbpA [Desulfoprunum benzoelyticum]MBM9530749.1 Hsp20/alpha crystallin family protein [Desulfoprunum benzoelyticum]